jgi:hypothetical protein
MKIRMVAGTMVMAAAMFAGLPVYAAGASLPTSGHEISNRAKMVSFHLRNDAKTPIQVKAGETELTLAPGKTVHVKAAAGASIVAENTTPNYATGTVVSMVSSALNGSTVVLR